MSFKNLIKILFFATLWLIRPDFAVAAKTVPTRITSEIIDIKRNSQTMEFFGNVVVRKAADTMIADKMTVFYEENEEPKKKAEPDDQNLTEEEKAKKYEELEKVRRRDKKLPKEEKQDAKIKRIDAYDHVKITSAEFVATGNKGHYDPNQDLFVLEENVMVNNGKSIANGEKFIYNLKTKKGNFVGKNKEEGKGLNKDRDGRVVVTIGEQDMKSKKKPKNEERKNSND